MLTWLAAHWTDALGAVGTVCAITFTGVGFWVDVHVRRAQTGIDITKQHREIWSYFDDREELQGLLDPKRDMTARQLTRKEAHFMSFLLNHLRATYYARKWGIYVQPEHLREDIAETLSLPAVRAFWGQSRRFHDRKFVKFVEGRKKK